MTSAIDLLDQIASTSAETFKQSVKDLVSEKLQHPIPTFDELRTNANGFVNWQRNTKVSSRCSLRVFLGSRIYNQLAEHPVRDFIINKIQAYQTSYDLSRMAADVIDKLPPSFGQGKLENKEIEKLLNILADSCLPDWVCTRTEPNAVVKELAGAVKVRKAWENIILKNSYDFFARGILMKYVKKFPLNGPKDKGGKYTSETITQAVCHCLGPFFIRSLLFAFRQFTTAIGDDKVCDYYLNTDSLEKYKKGQTTPTLTSPRPNNSRASCEREPMPGAVFAGLAGLSTSGIRASPNVPEAISHRANSASTEGETHFRAGPVYRTNSHGNQQSVPTRFPPPQQNSQHFRPGQQPPAYIYVPPPNLGCPPTMVPAPPSYALPSPTKNGSQKAGTVRSRENSDSVEGEPPAKTRSDGGGREAQENRELRGENIRLRLKDRDIEAKLEKMEAEKKRTKDEMANLRAELAKQSKSNQEKKEKLKQIRSEKEKENLDLKTTNEKMAEKLKKLEVEKEKERAANDRMKEEVKELAAREEKELAEIKQKEGMITALKQEIELLRGKVTQERTEKEEEIRKLTAERDNFEKINRDMITKAEEMFRKAREECEQMKENYKSQLEEKDKEIEKAAERQKEQDQALAEARRQQADPDVAHGLENQILQLRKELGKARGDCLRLQQDNQTLRGETDRVQVNYQNDANRRMRLEDRINELESQLREQIELAHSHEQVKEQTEKKVAGEMKRYNDLKNLYDEVVRKVDKLKETLLKRNREAMEVEAQLRRRINQLENVEDGIIFLGFKSTKKEDTEEWKERLEKEQEKTASLEEQLFATKAQLKNSLEKGRKKDIAAGDRLREQLTSLKETVKELEANKERIGAEYEAKLQLEQKHSSKALEEAKKRLTIEFEAKLRETTEKNAKEQDVVNQKLKTAEAERDQQFLNVSTMVREKNQLADRLKHKEKELAEQKGVNRNCSRRLQELEMKDKTAQERIKYQQQEMNNLTEAHNKKKAELQKKNHDLKSQLERREKEVQDMKKTRTKKQEEREALRQTRDKLTAEIVKLQEEKEAAVGKEKEFEQRLDRLDRINKRLTEELHQKKAELSNREKHWEKKYDDLRSQKESKEKKLNGEMASLSKELENEKEKSQKDREEKKQLAEELKKMTKDAQERQEKLIEVQNCYQKVFGPRK